MSDEGVAPVEFQRAEPITLTPVYIRTPCPHCSRTLNLPLEYLNRRVVCKHCNHGFLTQPRVRIPADAPPEVVEALTEYNRNRRPSAARGAPEGPSAPAGLAPVSASDTAIFL